MENQPWKLLSLVLFLRGRPYGGVGILLKNEFCKSIKFQKCLDRISVVVIMNYIFISVYIPSTNSVTDDIDIISEVLAEKEKFILDFPHHNIVWGGDFNANLSLGGAKALVINKFLIDHNLDYVKSNISSNVNIIDYT